MYYTASSSTTKPTQMLFIQKFTCIINVYTVIVIVVINLNLFNIFKILQVCGTSTSYTWITIVWATSNILCSKSNHNSNRAYTNSITGIYASPSKLIKLNFKQIFIRTGYSYFLRVHMIHNWMHSVILAAALVFAIKC